MFGRIFIKDIIKKNCCSLIWLFFLLDTSLETDKDVFDIIFTLSNGLNSNSFLLKGLILITIVIDDFYLFLLLIKLLFWYCGSAKKGLFTIFCSSIKIYFIINNVN